MTARLARTTLLTVLACIALVAGGAAAVADNTPDAEDPPSTPTLFYTITGTVTDQQGNPLAGIVVRIRDNGADEGALVGTATTNSAGRYLLKNLPGSYDSPYFGFTAVDPAGNYTPPIADGGSITGIPGGTVTYNWKMNGAGYIQGHVSIKDGDTTNPGVGAQVQIDKPGHEYMAMVDASGNFRMVGVPPGAYDVYFRANADGYANWCYDQAYSDNDGCHGGTKVTVNVGKTTTLRPQVLGLDAAKVASLSRRLQAGDLSALPGLADSIIDQILELLSVITGGVE